ncbi:hypothetical protein RZS08_28205, partial [Arthrospira platensis SPKY1]|nr:hypothetical protein [Arthrospira platensis SPKY1]
GDLNYSILSEIMEEVTKKAFYLAMRELLYYDELGLNNTWGSKKNKLLISGESFFRQARREEGA